MKLKIIQACTPWMGHFRPWGWTHAHNFLSWTEYVKAYPGHVDRVLLVDGLANISSALRHQLDTLAARGPAMFPKHSAELKALAASNASLFESIGTACSILGHLAIQRELHYATASGQARNERWDEESGLRACDSSRVAQMYAASGYMDSPHSELMKPLNMPAMILAGRQSSVIGAGNIESAAKALNIPVRWFENSGHFIYVEEPKVFAETIIGFVRHKDAGRSPWRMGSGLLTRQRTKVLRA